MKKAFCNYSTCNMHSKISPDTVARKVRKLYIVVMNNDD